MKRYHLEKQTRIYDDQPYCGYSSGEVPAEADTLEEAKLLQTKLQEINPVGWNIWDSETKCLVDGTDWLKE